MKQSEKMEILTEILKIKEKIEQEHPGLKEKIQSWGLDCDDKDDYLSDEEIEKLDAEIGKETYIKEYRDFVIWAFGENKEVGELSSFVLFFAERHPDLPLLKYNKHKFANQQQNILNIFFQASKHYFKHLQEQK